MFFLPATTLLLLSASAVHAFPWLPCGNLSASDCQSSDFSNLPNYGVAADSPLTATGTWSVVNNELTEVSRQPSNFGSPDCSNQLGVIRYMPTIANLSDLYHIRVKVRLNGTAAAGIVFGDNAGSYSRFQLNTNTSCGWGAQVVFRTAFMNQPGMFGQLVKLGGSAARNNSWYELRMRLSFSNQQTSRLDAQFIDQVPPPGPVSSGPAVTLDSPSLTTGSKIGLWCSSSVGCEFRDFVIVKDSLRGALSGPLDCQACNLMWQDGTADWCRCCQQDCAPFQRSGCVSKGLCTTMCLQSPYCPANVTAMTTTSTTITTTAPVTMQSNTTVTTTTAKPANMTTAAQGNTTVTTTTAKPANMTTAAQGNTTVTTTTAKPANMTTVAQGNSTVTTSTAKPANMTTAAQGNTTSTTMAPAGNTTVTIVTTGTSAPSNATTVTQAPSNATTSSSIATTTSTTNAPNATSTETSTATNADSTTTTGDGSATTTAGGDSTTASATGTESDTTTTLVVDDSSAAVDDSSANAVTISALAAAVIAAVLAF